MIKVCSLYSHSQSHSTNIPQLQIPVPYIHSLSTVTFPDTNLKLRFLLRPSTHLYSHTGDFERSVLCHQVTAEYKLKPGGHTGQVTLEHWRGGLYQRRVDLQVHTHTYTHTQTERKNTLIIHIKEIFCPKIFCFIITNKRLKKIS